MFRSPRLFLLLGLLAVLSSCHPDAASPAQGAQLAKSIQAAQASKVARAAAGPILSQDHDGALHFDERYLDSIDIKPKSSWSARTRREIAIYGELNRLELVKESLRKPSVKLTDSVSMGKPGEMAVRYRSNAVLLAEIYRKIDSLKVLEHLPVTPH